MKTDIIKEVLIKEEQIVARAKEIAKQLDKDYEGKEVAFVGIIKGCIPFMNNIVMNTNLYCTIDFIRANSFLGGLTSSGKLDIKDEYDLDVKGKDVVIIEDIIDSGKTLEAVSKYLYDKGAKSVEIVTMLSKPMNRVSNINVKYVGFNIPNVFVMGYGLDYEEKYRNLRCVATVDVNKLKGKK